MVFGLLEVGSGLSSVDRNETRREKTEISCRFCGDGTDDAGGLVHRNVRGTLTRAPHTEALRWNTGMET